MRLAQSSIASDEGHRGTVHADTHHNKPDTPDLMAEEPSTGDSWDSEHVGPDITFDLCEEFGPHHSHGTFEALVLKIVVELVTAEPKKSTIAGSSRVLSRSGRCIVVGSQGVVFPSRSGVRIIFSIPDQGVK